MLALFFAIAFGLSWGLLALFVAFTAPIEALLGPMGYTNPLFILAVYAPAIAGVVVVWRPDAQPWDSMIFAIMAAVVVAINRKTMFDHSAGATQLLLPAASPGRIPAAVHPTDGVPWGRR